MEAYKEAQEIFKKKMSNKVVDNRIEVHIGDDDDPEWDVQVVQVVMIGDAALLLSSCFFHLSLVFEVGRQKQRNITAWQTFWHIFWNLYHYKIMTPWRGKAGISSNAWLKQIPEYIAQNILFFVLHVCFMTRASATKITHRFLISCRMALH